MWEVGDATVRQFDGGYAAYVLARAERARQADASEARRQNLLRKELAWLRRGAPARTSKPRFRIDAAEALIADVPDARAAASSCARWPSAASGRRSSTSRTSPSPSAAAPTRRRRTLLDHVTWHVGPGDRIGIIGVNGSGKTHLLRLLAGDLQPDSGTVTIGQTVHVGHLTQEIRELPDTLRVLEAVSEVRTHAPSSDGVEHVARASSPSASASPTSGSGRRSATCPAASGGACSCCGCCSASPTCCCWTSRPTTSTPTPWPRWRTCSTGWAGTLVVVSHDRYLLERVCDTTVALLGDGSLAALPGGVEEYLAPPGRGGPADAGADERRENAAATPAPRARS